MATHFTDISAEKHKYYEQQLKIQRQYVYNYS